MQNTIEGGYKLLKISREKNESLTLSEGGGENSSLYSQSPGSEVKMRTSANIVFI